MIEVLERRILTSLQRLHNRPLNFFFTLITHSARTKAWYGFAAILWLIQLAGLEILPRQKEFLQCLFAPLLAWGLSKLLKKKIARDRPIKSIHGFNSLIKSPSCGSFPSSHSSTAFALFGSLLYLGHPLAAYVGIWAFLVGSSRVYLGVHYPTDVFGGGILGFFTGMVFSALKGW